MPPKELVEIEDAARAVTQSLALLKQHSSFSSQNLSLEKYEWSPASRDVSLAAVTDLAIPAWVERQYGNNVNADDNFWPNVQVCNLAELEGARIRGEWNKCAFYIDSGVMRIRFSYDPTDFTPTTHRLWYSPNVDIADAFNDTALEIGTTNFFPYVSALAELELIPTMLIKIGLLKNDAYNALGPALENRQAYLQAKAAVWHDRFKHFTYGERGNRKGGRRRNILPRGLTI